MVRNIDTRLRVLGICYEDPEVKIGGMGRHVGELYRHMAMRDDIQIDLLTTGPDAGPKIHNGYVKHYTDKLVAYKPRIAGLVANLAVDIQGLRTVLRLVTEGYRWDVVHIHDWNCVQLGRAIRDAFNIPLIGTMHLSLTYLMETGGVYDRDLLEDEIYTMQMEGHLVADTDQLILCSKAFSETVRETFMIKRPINLIANGIDLAEWHPYIEKKALPFFTDRPIALYVGRIADMKGIRELLEAVESKDNGYLTVLCGDVNADTDEIKEHWDVTKKIRALEAKYPERLIWIGFQQDDTLKQLYRHATVGIMPSLHEPFGIVALEFMAMGVPLISTEVDGLGEIVNGNGEEYALIIPAGNSKAINKALALCRDYGVRAELGALGLTRVQKYDWYTVANQTIEVYRRAVNDRINRRNTSKELDTAQGSSS